MAESHVVSGLVAKRSELAVLMGLMADNKLDFKEALDSLDITPNKVRGGAAKGRFGGSKQTDLHL